jgi:hypothetical protein
MHEAARIRSTQRQGSATLDGCGSLERSRRIDEAMLLAGADDPASMQGEVRNLPWTGCWSLAPRRNTGIFSIAI